MSSTGAEDGVGTKVVIGVIGVIAAIAALLVVLFGARVLIGGSSADEEPTTAQTRGDTTSEEETSVEPIPKIPERRQITLIARPDRPATARSTYADLDDGDVVQIAIRSDGPSRGTIEQCVVRRRDGADRLSACGNALPVVTDADGVADVLYQVVDTGRCGPRDRCVVVVRFPNDGTTAYGGTADAFIVFGDGPRELTVEVEPAGPYLDGDAVLLDIGAVTPGAAVSVRWCGETCADPIIGAATADGRFSATIEIDAECDRCEVIVSAGARELAVPVSIADRPGASYSVERLVAGLLAAIGFFAAAVLVARRTDWRPPSEAATPAFDGPWRWDDLLDDE